MLSKEEIKREKFGQEQSFWLWNLAILHMLLAEHKFSSHLSASRIKILPVSVGSQ
jgi:hypothetical protein